MINRPCTKDTCAGDYGSGEKLPNNYLNHDMLAPTSERNGEMRGSNKRQEETKRRDNNRQIRMRVGNSEQH